MVYFRAMFHRYRDFWPGSWWGRINYFNLILSLLYHYAFSSKKEEKDSFTYIQHLERQFKENALTILNYRALIEPNQCDEAVFSRIVDSKQPNINAKSFLWSFLN